jgi:hypothetical protein
MRFGSFINKYTNIIVIIVIVIRFSVFQTPSTYKLILLLDWKTMYNNRIKQERKILVSFLS